MKAENIKILCALQIIGDSRNSKRIAMLQDAGFKVEAIAFERKFHKGRQPSCRVQTIGKIKHGHYLSRAMKMLAAMPAIRRAIKSNDMIYASGADMALICLLSGLGLGRPIALETADIRELQTAKGITGRIVRAVDKWLANSCSLLVVTAPGFIDGYYRQWLKVKTPALIIENKLEARKGQGEESQPNIGVMASTPLVDRPLRIGYFGLLRWESSWRILSSLASARPDDIEIVIAGHVMEPVDLLDQVESYGNITYRGEYCSPDDLPSLFNSVDLIWAVYPDIGSEDWNLRWARTNRFYESCFFQTPIISRAGCSDAKEINRHKIGLTIDEQELDKIVAQLHNITPEDIKIWWENMANLPQNIYTYTTETEQLKQALLDIAIDQHLSDNSLHEDKLNEY
ncbi:MAG: hypothetical protein JKX99_11555 [Robiginitomaculum sp.]|nr:hypothetical protein [Robiginitomaculum sp.]